MKMMIDQELRSHEEVFFKTKEDLSHHIYTAVVIVNEVLKNGKKILLFGNGGSAADAQHIAAELTGRYKLDRKGLPAIALTTDTSAITAISNDFGYKNVFKRQVEALANEGDLLIGISTSGNSKNVLRALKLGREMGCKTLGLSGGDGGEMSQYCDLNIVVPSSNTPRIQEMHIMIGHIICQGVDRASLY